MSSNTYVNGLVGSFTSYVNQARNMYLHNQTTVNRVFATTFFLAILFGFVDFTIITMFYLLGLTFYSVISRRNETENQVSIAEGWLLYGSLLFFDFVLVLFGSVLFTPLFRLARIVLYVVQTRNFIRYMEQNRDSIFASVQAMKDVPLQFQQEGFVAGVDTIAPFFMDLVTVNSVFLQKVCVDWNIEILRYITTPMSWFASQIVEKSPTVDTSFVRRMYNSIHSRFFSSTKTD
jgi:hypothetical protein